MTKIGYRLQRDEDGFPPISLELLNAEEISTGKFRICNAPYFAENVSYHDIVRARVTDVSGQLEFVELIEPSEFTSISIILLNELMDRFLMDLLRGLDCVVEYGEFGVYRVLAVAIPPSTDYASLKAQLADLEKEEQISFAELSIAQRIPADRTPH
jgi:hypothetical protein